MTGQPTDPTELRSLAHGCGKTATILRQCADEIERLRAELAKRTRERDWAVHYEQRYLTRAVTAEKAVALSVPSVREHPKPSEAKNG